jgi:hypothetical protein
LNTAAVSSVPVNEAKRYSIDAKQTAHYHPIQISSKCERRSQPANSAHTNRNEEKIKAHKAVKVKSLKGFENSPSYSHTREKKVTVMRSKRLFGLRYWRRRISCARRNGQHDVNRELITIESKNAFAGSVATATFLLLFVSPLSHPRSLTSSSSCRSSFSS